MQGSREIEARPGQPAGAEQAPRGARWARSWRRRVCAILGASLGALALALGVLFVLLRLEPRWWPRLDPASPAVIDLGTRLENSVITQVHLVRPGLEPSRAADAPPWSVSVSEDDANAWLATRLPKWMANRLPDGQLAPLSDVRVRFETGMVRVGARVGGLASPVWLELDPRVPAPGRVQLRVRAMYVGRVRLPISTALEWSEPLTDPPELESMRRALAAGESPTFDAVLPLDDGRRVQLEVVTPRQGRLDLTARTLGSAARVSP